jgi:outer membrane receptor protein involved in Fe transport
VRTPTRVDRDQALGNVSAQQAALFGCRLFRDGLCVLGDPTTPSWKVQALEAGWRWRPGAPVDLDLAVFRNRVATGATGPGATTHSRQSGAEAVLRWRVVRGWRLEAQATAHGGHDTLVGGAVAPLNLLPRREWSLASRWTGSGGWTIDADLGSVSAVQRRGTVVQPTVRLPRATRLDLRGGLRLGGGLELSFGAQNLLEPARAESFEAAKVNTGVRRGVFASVTQRW